jgi:hypothetical protein
MITLDSLNEIKQWFRENDTVEFELPDGYLGRPFDNIYIFDSIGIDNVKNILIIKFNINEIKIFTLYGEISYKFIDGCLEISNFDSLVFEWEKIGKTEIGSKKYDFGIVRFIPSSKFLPKD